MHPCGVFASCQRKEDVLVLAGPHLHTSTGFAILCKVCGVIVSKTINMCRRRKSWNW